MQPKNNERALNLMRQYLLPQLYAITQKGHLSVIEEEFEKIFRV